MDLDIPNVHAVKLEEFCFIDKSLLEKALVCNICSKPLNVSPIIYSENIGNICGRCSSAASLNGLGAILHQQTYEDLIKNLTFPCANKNYGCLEVLQFVDVQEHEKTCRFQCMNCPLFYKHLFPEKLCSWTGNVKLLPDHLKMHQEEFLDPPQFTWPENKQTMIFFTTVGNQIITVVLKFERGNKYSCLVMVNGTDLESQCFRYQLELGDEERNNTLIFRRNRLECLAGFLDDLRCPDRYLEVDLEKISEMLKHPKKIVAKFGIVKKNKKEITQLTGVKDGEVLNGSTVILGKEKSEPPDEDMLFELECPVCNEYMIPPIFICATGHSVCGDCKLKVSCCPSCRCDFADGRNFTLEKLTLKVKYPCRNREIGCGYVTTSDKIKLHQKNCELSENQCILNCGWKGLFPGMYNHFLDVHGSSLLQHNIPILKDIKHDKNPGHYFLYVMGEMFCLSLKNCGKFTLKFNVQHVGMMGIKPKYKYTIQFTGSATMTCPNLSLTNFCSSWNDNLSDALNTCCTISADLLKPFVFHHLYYFKICITKL